MWAVVHPYLSLADMTAIDIEWKIPVPILAATYRESHFAALNSLTTEPCISCRVAYKCVPSAGLEEPEIDDRL